MPLYPGLLALSLLAPGPARAQPVPPVVPAAAAAANPANLLRKPELASDFDRVLLLDAGCTIEKTGGVLDKDREPLDEPALKTLLESLRAARKEKTLAELEAVQEEYAKTGKLTPGQAERLRAALQGGWPLVPDDVRAGFNEMLAHEGATTVRGAKLDWVERAAKSWDKAGVGGFDADVPRGVEPGVFVPAMPKSAKTFWHGDYDDEFSPPSAKVVASRAEAVDQATWRDPKTGDLKPYSDEIKDALRVIARYADGRDGEAMVRVLKDLHPVIEIGDGAVPAYAFGVAEHSDRGGGGALRIGLARDAIFYGGSKKDDDYRVLPQGDPAYYKALGIPTPNLAALDPNAKPESSHRWAYYGEDYFADGSVRRRYTALGLAPTLMHELMHLDTYRLGGGEQSFSNEMRSMTAERRLAYNRDEARGLTRDGEYSINRDWIAGPLDFRRGILAEYQSKEIGEVKSGEETVDGMIAAQRRLASGGDLNAWRNAQIVGWVDRGRDNKLKLLDDLESGGLLSPTEAELGRQRVLAAAEAARKKLLAEPADSTVQFNARMDALQRDRELTLGVFLEDWRWHQERGVGVYGPPSTGAPK